MSVVGTRPEAIKMAPVIKALQAHSNMKSVLCLTAQHREMLDQVLQIFAIKGDFDLDLMQPSQTLNGLSSRIFQNIDEIITSAKPDVVLVHGDTTTAFVTSVACFHRNIPVGHVEAGLRTHDLKRPFPEEMNRRIVDIVSTYLFAPTARAKQNLLAEGVVSDEIHVTGNTIVDSLRFMIAKIDADSELQLRLAERFPVLPSGRKLVLVTGHRRESFGPGFERICQALRRIAARGDVELVYPVHLNPNVSKPVNSILGRARRVHLIPPVDYMTFVHLLSRAAVVITDSGGVQEEAVSLGKRVLVLRELTERPEGVEAGLAHLVGTDPNLICSKFKEVMEVSDETTPETNQSVYGDGKAACRIVAALAKSQGLRNHSATEQIRSSMHVLHDLAASSLAHAEEQALQSGA
ncbi:MAG: non-hydrolyzing UDP-N-acetylglucosamine 2-epimerase [Methylocella sp.]